MKHMWLMCIGLWLCLWIPAGAQTPEPESVLGYTWGTRYKTCLRTLKDRGVPVKVVKNESIQYTLAGIQTELEFDEILGLNTIIVSQTFTAENAKAGNTYFNDELRTLTRSFGEYNTHQTHTGLLHRFEWKLKKTAISLTYFTSMNTVTTEYSRIFNVE